MSEEEPGVQCGVNRCSELDSTGDAVREGSRADTVGTMTTSVFALNAMKGHLS